MGLWRDDHKRLLSSNHYQANLTKGQNHKRFLRLWPFAEVTFGTGDSSIGNEMVDYKASRDERPGKEGFIAFKDKGLPNSPHLEQPSGLIEFEPP
jgi:hypothetical protein